VQVVPDISHIKIEIVEQPSSNNHRFRYQSEQPNGQKEGKAIGALFGKNTTTQNRIYPTIKVTGYEGPATIIATCVEDKEPFRAHPNNLIGKNCVKGICRMIIGPETKMTAVFEKIGIECVRRNDIPTSLKHRLEMKGFVDPFGLGFNHMASKTEMAAMDMNSVRLSFQLFIPWTNSQSQAYTIPGAKVFSDVIKDKRVHESLKIIDISDDFSPVKGGKKIIMFTSKIKHDDIEVHFEYNHNDLKTVLVKHIGASEIHKQCAISFSTPMFPDQKITQEIQGKIYLFRPSDKAISNEEDFSFRPNQQNAITSKEKSTLPQLDKAMLICDKQELSPIKPNQIRKRIKEKIVKATSQNLDTAEEHSTREMENKPKRHPSTDCGGKVEMIETSTFTNEILNGANPWLGSTTSTISYEDMKDIMSISPKDQSFSPETPGSEQGS
jgi:hypothetical protein